LTWKGHEIRQWTVGGLLSSEGEHVITAKKTEF
jgi:hypothetical protein